MNMGKMFVLAVTVGIFWRLVPGLAGAISWQKYHPEEYEYPYPVSDFDGMYYDAESVKVCSSDDDGKQCIYFVGKEVEPDLKRIYLMRMEPSRCFTATLCYKQGGEWHFPKAEWKYVGRCGQFPMLQVMGLRMLNILDRQKAEKRLKILKRPLDPAAVKIPADQLN